MPGLCDRPLGSCPDVEVWVKPSMVEKAVWAPSGCRAGLAYIQDE